MLTLESAVPHSRHLARPRRARDTGVHHLSLPLEGLPRARLRVYFENPAIVVLVLALPFGEGMSEMPTHQGYDQPTVLWRMKRANGLVSHAVVDIRASRAIVTWFVNQRPLGS